MHEENTNVPKLKILNAVLYVNASDNILGKDYRVGQVFL